MPDIVCFVHISVHCALTQGWTCSCIASPASKLLACSVLKYGASLRIMSNFYLLKRVTSLLQNPLTWRTRVFIQGSPFRRFVVTLGRESYRVIPTGAVGRGARIRQVAAPCSRTVSCESIDILRSLDQNEGDGLYKSL
jgi:hypothetical protein